MTNEIGETNTGKATTDGPGEEADEFVCDSRDGFRCYIGASGLIVIHQDSWGTSNTVALHPDEARDLAEFLPRLLALVTE